MSCDACDAIISKRLRESERIWGIQAVRDPAYCGWVVPAGPGKPWQLRERCVLTDQGLQSVHAARHAALDSD